MKLPHIGCHPERSPPPRTLRRTCWLLRRAYSVNSLSLCFDRGHSGSGATNNHRAPVVLDRVVAVVNKHAILASDIDDEIRLSVLDPNLVGQGTLTRQHALEQLISRALIEQQIREQDMQAVAPTQDEVNARLEQIRKQLPACVRENCATDAGWKAFLAAHALTPDRVEAYLRYRLEILELH